MYRKLRGSTRPERLAAKNITALSSERGLPAYDDMDYLIATAGLIAAVAAAGVSTSPPSPSPAATIHIANFAFVPAKVTIAPGQSIRFVNDDAEAHTVTARDRSFDSTGLDLHDAWQHRFATIGTYDYYCQLHPMMTGTVVVAAGTQR